MKAAYVSMLRLLVKGTATRAAADKDENDLEKRIETEEISLEKRLRQLRLGKSER